MNDTDGNKGNNLLEIPNVGDNANKIIKTPEFGVVKITYQDSKPVLVSVEEKTKLNKSN